MVLIAIWVGTLAAGIGSVWIAAALSFGALARYTQHMLSLAAGALLATAFTLILPEAFEGPVDAQNLFTTLLLGLVFFFLLDKAELWHHGHEHSPAERQLHGHGTSHAYAEHGHQHDHHDHHDHDHHHHHHHHHHHGHGGWSLLTGDSVHCFGDGVLIASAFVADVRLGLIAAVSVLAHEVPHHMGDLVVLRQTSANRRMALLKVSLAGAVTALGGAVGYFLVGQLQDFLPYFLAVASSSFVYVALADLIPQLQKRLTARETIAQIAWLIAGMVVVMMVSGLAHNH